MTQSWRSVARRLQTGDASIRTVATISACGLTYLTSDRTKDFPETHHYPGLGERQMILDIIAGAVIVGVGGWAWKKLIHRWAETGKRF